MMVVGSGSETGRLDSIVTVSFSLGGDPKRREVDDLQSRLEEFEERPPGLQTATADHEGASVTVVYDESLANEAVVEGWLTEVIGVTNEVMSRGG